jgi:hypothetical protein
MPKKILINLSIPNGYWWLLDKKLIGFEPFTQLQPWYYLSPDQCFWVSNRWPNVTNKYLLAFARRQDCDDLACFVVDNNIVNAIALIHGWTAEGYNLVREFSDFKDWLKYVIDDIYEWGNLSNNSQ